MHVEISCFVMSYQKLLSFKIEEHHIKSGIIRHFFLQKLSDN